MAERLTERLPERLPKRLAGAEWTRREDLAALVDALGPGNARYVGGAVRDTLLGLPAKDIDLATTLEPRAVMDALRAAEIRAIPTGMEHGTVTAILSGGPVEITTLRRDVATDGRRATVAFATDWREDAARRDFTINALYADPATHEIFDYFGGLDDLSRRTVRFIGDAAQRIREDHLRILRYFRFQARFGSQPADEQAERACAELAGTLKGLSRERVGMELLTILGLPDPAPTITRMAELEVLVAEEKRQDVPPDPIRRLAALLPAAPALAEQVAARFRLSGAQKKRLASAAARGEAGADARVLAYRIGREEALDRLLIAGDTIAPLTGWTVPRFPIKGGEIVARGVKAGPDVARLLREVEERWIAEGFPGRERALALLDRALAA